MSKRKKEEETIMIDGELVQGEIHVEGPPEMDTSDAGTAAEDKEEFVPVAEVPLPAKLAVAFENAYNNAKVRGKAEFMVVHEDTEWSVSVERHDG